MEKCVATSIDDYRLLKENDCYYVDKTLLIEEFLKNKGNQVTLITRPRRFGKTLNMTMMREFFDITKTSNDIFKETKIMNTKYAKHLNSVPVLYFTFKDCGGNNKELLIDNIRDTIFQEYRRYKKIFDYSKMTEDNVKIFEDIHNRLMFVSENYDELVKIITKSIKVLSQIVFDYFEKKVIILLDEYDNPFIEAKVCGYYDKVREVLATLFVKTFKGNEYADKSLLTGIQRIAQESIFSKFNNPCICTVIDEDYDDKFGLTADETKKYLDYFGYKLTEDVVRYYDGYKIFNVEIFNPLSISTYISKKGRLNSYWINTSSNSLIKQELINANKEFFEEFSELIEKGTAIIEIDFSTTFAEEQNTMTLWGMFVNAGYITVEEIIEDDCYKVRIPNAEVSKEFSKIINSYVNIRK